jgi:uncharacterized protein (TIRG00374 family)
MKISRVLQLAGGLAIAGAGLYIFLHNIDYTRLWKEIYSTPVLSLVIVALLSPLTLWLRAIRWRLILPKSSTTHTRGLFQIVVIGFMVNNILPARIGEAARALYLWKNNRFTVAQSIGSLVVERFLDTLAFLSFFALPVFMIPSLAKLRIYAFLFVLIFAGSVIVMFLYSRFPKFTKNIASKLIVLFPHKFRDRIGHIGLEVASNLDWLFSGRKVIMTVLFSYLTILCYPFMLMSLVGKEQPLSFLGGMFGQACAAMGAAIPLAPGYVGTVHAALRQAMTMLGISVDKAAAVAILYHALSYVVITALGLIFFFSANVSLKDIQSAKNQLDKKVEEPVAENLMK